MAIEPPSPEQRGAQFYRGAKVALRVDGVPTSEEIMSSMRDLKPRLPAEAPLYSFFIENWNCYMHLAVLNPELEWAGPIVSASADKGT
jgi:hypothetical protein